MKKLVLLLIFSISSGASANASEWAALSVLLGGAVGSGILAYNGSTSSELPGWSDSILKTTVQLQTGCGVITESRLIGDNAYNYLFLVVKNVSGENREFVYDQIQMNFSEGLHRLPSLVFNSSPYIIQDTQVSWGYFPFPSKNDFERSNELVIRVPIRKKDAKDICWVESRFVKNQNVVDTRSYNSLTSFDFQIGGGVNLIRAGQQGDFATSGGGVFELGISGFGGTHWGGTMLVHSNYIRSHADASKLTSLTKLAGMDPNLSTLHMMLGPSYRSWFSEKLMWAYDIGPSLGVALYEESGKSERQSGAFLTFDQRIRLNYRFYRKREGIWRGDYGIGVGLSHSWTPPFSSVNGVSFGGNNLTFTIHFTIGG